MLVKTKYFNNSTFRSIQGQASTNISRPSETSSLGANHITYSESPRYQSKEKKRKKHTQKFTGHQAYKAKQGNRNKQEGDKEVH